MQDVFQIRGKLLHQVAQQDFTHLLMAELDPLDQRAIEVVGIPVGGDHARAIGARNLGHIERQPPVAPIDREGHLEGVLAAREHAVASAGLVARVEPADPR